MVFILKFKRGRASISVDTSTGYHICTALLLPPSPPPSMPHPQPIPAAHSISAITPTHASPVCTTAHCSSPPPSLHPRPCFPSPRVYGQPAMPTHHQHLHPLNLSATTAAGTPDLGVCSSPAAIAHNTGRLRVRRVSIALLSLQRNSQGVYPSYTSLVCTLECQMKWMMSACYSLQIPN